MDYDEIAQKLIDHWKSNRCINQNNWSSLEKDDIIYALREVKINTLKNTLTTLKDIIEKNNLNDISDLSLMQSAMEADIETNKKLLPSF